MRAGGQIGVIAAAALLFAGPAGAAKEPEADPGAPKSPATDTAPAAESAGQEPLTDPELGSGFILYSAESGNWDLRLRFPFSVGLTKFDLNAPIEIGNVSTLTVVPTLEFIVPLDERWALLPFVGAGGAAAVGDQKPTSGENLIGIATGGLRAERWQPFAGRYVSALSVETRYSAAMTPRNGLLGDWGSLTGALELRRSFGAPRDGPRFQAGVYAQGFWFWDPVEFEIEGVTPTFLHTQKEFGISVGSSEPFKLWRITLPRMYFGARFGKGVRTLQLRFGRL